MNFDQHRTAIINLRQSMATEAKQLLSAVFADFFKQCPDVAAVRFAAYTVHFNDGDPVYYTVEESEVELKTSTILKYKCCGKELEAADAFCSKCGRKQPSPEERQERLRWRDCYSVDDSQLAETMKKLDDFLCLCEDILLTTFGDHKRIVARAKSAGIVFDVEEYKDHH